MPLLLPFIIVFLWFSPVLGLAGEITANQIQRDTNGIIHAEGNVHLKSEGIDIIAEALSFNTDSQAAEIVSGRIQFDDKQKLTGSSLRRIDLENFEATDVTYTVCPDDEQAWMIKADSAHLSRDEGVFTARGASFVLGGVPVLYTPYWSHALTRRSGLLTPKYENSTRRGVGISTPFYWAASPDWDMTFTPKWMSLRGLMADVEWRHRSLWGKEWLKVQSIEDKETGTQRGRLRTNMTWQPSSSIDAALKIDAASDGLYVADFPSAGDIASAAYLTSSATVAWRDGSDSAIFSSRYQQLLGGVSNAATLQVMPRLQTRHYFWDSLKLEHQTTVFQRDVGVSGIRSGLRPSWSVPWQMYGGAVSANWTVMGQYVGYDSKNFTSASSSYAAAASSLQMQGIFERIFDDGQWRHEVKPVVRIDVSSAPDQADNPRYDSNLLPLNFSNLMQGNRYSGWDRFERMGRVSMLLESSLQEKENQQNVRTVWQGKVGVVWDGLKETVDAATTPAATREVSNFLGELAWMPSAHWKATAGGQLDSSSKRWVEAHSSLSWIGQEKQYFNIGWQRTDASYAQQAKSLSVAGRARINQRWSSHATGQYDLLRNHMTRATMGVAYAHACWDMSLEGFTNYQVGTNSITDIGWRFLIAFEGLGSFGDS